MPLSTLTLPQKEEKITLNQVIHNASHGDFSINRRALSTPTGTFMRTAVCDPQDGPPVFLRPAFGGEGAHDPTGPQTFICTTKQTLSLQRKPHSYSCCGFRRVARTRKITKFFFQPKIIFYGPEIQHFRLDKNFLFRKIILQTVFN